MVDLSNNPIVAFIEGGVVVAEFLICITFCTILTSFIQSTAWETHLPDILQHVVAVINWSMSSLLVLIWITCRYLSYIKSPKEPMPPWFGLSLKRFFQPSKTSLFISFLLVLEFIVTIYWTSLSGDEPELEFDMFIKGNITYTFSELYKLPFSQLMILLDWNSMFRLTLLTPLVEEYIFRGVLFSIVLGRTKRMNWISILIPNIIFGLFHLVNVPSTRFSIVYIFLQIFMGLLVGTFYTVHLIYSQSLCETIMLHLVNNFLSGMLPRNNSFTEIMSSTFFIQLIYTIGFYFTIVFLESRYILHSQQLKKKDEKTIDNKKVQ